MLVWDWWFGSLGPPLWKGFLLRAKSLESPPPPGPKTTQLPTISCMIAALRRPYWPFLYERIRDVRPKRHWSRRFWSPKCPWQKQLRLVLWENGGIHPFSPQGLPYQSRQLDVILIWDLHPRIQQVFGAPFLCDFFTSFGLVGKGTT